ncbi:hypothetical protein ZOSMA_6248G00010 [Zostera marina]|uniref:Uncharacterized protein n=1 Tax=Zostera marina TaxID=29655 RepID=A0A0K9NVJ1_ZOSMR|nr:hypothetical protein ZOSMA_6248G00010 [Zostera marina]
MCGTKPAFNSKYHLSRMGCVFSRRVPRLTYVLP